MTTSSKIAGSKNPGLSGLVLIGGKSSRMGSDKSLITYHGRSHALYLRDILFKYCREVYFSAKDRESVPPELREVPAIFDLPDMGGPAAGIVSALKSKPGMAWLVLACDLPFVDETGLQKLIDSRDRSKIATAYASPGQGLPEPVYAIYEPSALDAFENGFKADLRCPRKILLQSGPNLIKAPDPIILENANFPEQRENAIKMLKQSHAPQENSNE